MKTKARQTKKLKRVMSIFITMYQHTPVNIYKLAKHFKSSVRSVQRDIALLRELEIRMQTDSKGTYWMKPAGNKRKES